MLAFSVVIHISTVIMATEAQNLANKLCLNYYTSFHQKYLSNLFGQVLLLK